ncbi:unnamed protein product [Peniophora sp. CBMAI 1063]|nr:unnamed protein product [Peniophora sp. CBMAI 1063]
MSDEKTEKAVVEQFENADIDQGVATVPGDVDIKSVHSQGHADSLTLSGFLRSWKKQNLDGFYAEALAKYGHDGAITPEMEKRLVRRLDWIILPMISVCYFFYYVDKTTLSYAAIFGFKKDLSLNGDQYSWLSSVFYLGWLVWALPANMLLQKAPPAYYLGINIFLWGVLLMCQSAAKNFTGLMVLRFFSGAFEAVADPCFTLMTAMFYTREEQPWRISIWYAFNGVGIAGGGLLGYAIGHINGALASWRYEFIIVGCLCAFWGLMLLALLPNSPASARMFTREERLMLVARLRKNQTGVENRTWKWDQVWDTVSDPIFYMFFALGFIANIPNGGISNFSTIIIKGLKFNTLQTSLLTIPQGAFTAGWIIIGAVINQYAPKNSRTWICIAMMLPSVGGTLGLLLAPQDARIGRLFAYYMTGAHSGPFVIGLSLWSSNAAGQTKKMLLSGSTWLGVAVGNIVGPFFFIDSQAPSYGLGIGAIMVCNILEMILFYMFRLIYAHRNKVRDRRQAEQDAQGSVPHENATTFSDMTDRQNPNFRYVY